MTSTVQTSGSLGICRGNNRTIFRNPRGQKSYYAFYRYNVTSIAYEYSTNGTVWTNSPVAVLSLGSPGPMDSFDVKIYDDGSDLYVYIVGHGWWGNTDQRVIYKRGVISDATSTISWGSENTVKSSITDLGSIHNCAITRTDNGELVVAFTEHLTLKGKDYCLIKLIGSDGDGAAPSWSGEITLVDTSTNTNNQNKFQVWFGLESYSSSYGDKVFFYGRVPESTLSYGYSTLTSVPIWDQGGAGFTNQALALWANPESMTGYTVSGLVDDGDIAHFVYQNNDNTNDLYYRKAGSAGDDNLGTARSVWSSAITYVHDLTITLDTGPTTDLLYVFYCLPSDSVDCRYKTVPINSTTFSSEKIVSYHQNITALTSWSRVIENSLHIGGLYGTTVIYNEHPVYKALSTTLADLEFPDRSYYLGPHST